MRTYITIAIALLFTSCSYKTNMWHYEDAGSRITNKTTATREHIEATPAPAQKIEEQIGCEEKQAATGKVNKENTLPGKEGLSHSRSIIKDQESTGNIAGRIMQEKQVKYKRSVISFKAADTSGDLITDLITALFVGLLLCGVVIGLLIALVAAAISGTTWAAWVLAIVGLVMLTGAIFG